MNQIRQKITQIMEKAERIENEIERKIKSETGIRPFDENHEISQDDRKDIKERISKRLPIQIR